jgi:ribokinase
MGGDGLVYMTRDGISHAIAPIKVTVRSTHGAGDCFVGTLARELSTGRPLGESCEIANRSAAAYVSAAASASGRAGG